MNVPVVQAWPVAVVRWRWHGRPRHQQDQHSNLKDVLLLTCCALPAAPQPNPTQPFALPRRFAVYVCTAAERTYAHEVRSCAHSVSA